MRAFTITLLCCLLTAAKTEAQYFFQTKIVNNNYITTPYQGAAVCISGDGKTMMIGAPRDSNKRGSVHVYNRQGSAWVFDTTIFVPLTGVFMSGNIIENGFGGAIAMSRDGSRAAISRWGQSGGGGGVWIFEKDANGDWFDASGWIRPMSDPDAFGARYGIALDMTDDGSMVLVGASAYGVSGAAYIIYKGTSSWATYKVYTGNGNAGLDVAISGNGQRIFIGEPTANKIQEFEQNSGWQYKGYVPVITTSFPSLQGGSIAASYTGDTLVAGSISFGGTIWGAVAMKRSTAGAWSQLGNSIMIFNTTAAGMRIALSDDARKLALSTAEEGNGVGAAYYTEMDNTGNWITPLKLFGNGAIGNAHQGYGLSMSGDASVIASGGYSDNVNTGATWVFTQMQPQLMPGTINGSPFCQSTSYSVTVPYSGNMTGGMYTVQLSDANGSFTSAVDIGSGSSNPIIASIPPNTPAGSNYRIRVVYNDGGDLNKAFTGDQNSTALEVNTCIKQSVYETGGMSLKVYPNPAADGFRIDGLQKAMRYTMLNAAGAEVQTGELSPQASTVKINLSGGVYFISLYDGMMHAGSIRLQVQR